MGDRGSAEGTGRILDMWIPVGSRKGLSFYSECLREGDTWS